MNHYKYLINLVVFYLFYNYIIKAFLILTIIVGAGIVLGIIMTSRSTSNATTDNIEPTLDSTPSVLVEEEETLLKTSTIACCEKKDMFMKIYKIQDTMYVDGYKPWHLEFISSYEKLVKFELKEVDSEIGFDSNYSELSDVYGDEELIVITKRLGSGYLINSNVYLTMQQWHTIVSYPEILPDLLNCSVCDAYFHVSMADHINTDEHTNQLDKYRPLRRFEYSITRKINNSFHCAVCNVTYSVAEQDRHKNNNSHEINLLAAINKATEYIYNNDDSDQNCRITINNYASEFRGDNNGYITDHSVFGNDDSSRQEDFDAISIDSIGSDVDSDYMNVDNDSFDVKNDDSNDRLDRAHRNRDVAPVKLIKYVKFNTEDTATGTDIFKRSNVIQLTSNCAVPSVTESQINREHSKLGVNGNIITGNQKESHKSNDNQEAVTFDDFSSSSATESHNAKSNEIFDPSDRYMDENIQIIIKKTHFVIDLFAYNTIVFHGDCKYCFLCKILINNGETQRHIRNRSHIDNMLKHSFLENYSKHLIRQNHFKYHCGICNVVINHTHLTNHMDWATHQKLSIQCKTKKSLRKSIKVINVATQREDRVSHVNAPKVKILLHVQIVATPQVTQTIVKVENKKVILNGRMLIIEFYNWHGLCKLDNGFRCLICQVNVTENIEMHCKDRHNDDLLENIDENYWPALMRKINDSYVHCISCNKFLFNDPEIIARHIQVKKHIKNHSKFIKE